MSLKVIDSECLRGFETEEFQIPKSKLEGAAQKAIQKLENNIKNLVYPLSNHIPTKTNTA